MTDLATKIKVMQAALDGEEIQYKLSRKKWESYIDGAPSWNWSCIDYRIKPKSLELEKEIISLKEKLELVYQVGQNGIAHVGAANYASREREASDNLDKAMYGEE